MNINAMLWHTVLQPSKVCNAGVLKHFHVTKQLEKIITGHGPLFVLSRLRSFAVIGSLMNVLYPKVDTDFFSFQISKLNILQTNMNWNYIVLWYKTEWQTFPAVVQDKSKRGSSHWRCSLEIENNLGDIFVGFSKTAGICHTKMYL